MKAQISRPVWAMAALFILLTSIAVFAQRGIRGQVFLPNGAPLQQQVRISLETANGMRVESYYTDSNGRIQLPSISGWFTITVESDGQTYGTTSANFNSENSSYITLHLRPLNKPPTSPPGLVNINDVDRNVAPSAHAAYEDALAFLQRDQFEPAVEALKQAIKFQPDYFHAHNDLGVAYLKLEKFDLAVEALQQAIKINNKIYLPQLNLGIVYNKQGKYKEAADLLTKVQDANPDLWKVHAPLIEALIGAQMWQAAEEAIKRALIRKEADAVDLKTKLGLARIKQGHFAAAIPPLREAIKEEADHALAQFNLGVALMQTGSLKEAEAALLHAYKLQGAKMAGAQLLLGQIYHQQQDYQKAIAAFEAYLRDLPDAPNAATVKQAIERLRAALKKPI